ncbi:unnamed protein product [Meganyctiphanes norvegica]|uniref:Uncharacterized protein n=1 Tax=Meganyctiphanes norvegica TaxID=48144 RepID=A0AAV2PRX3_MEGNR
MSLFGRLTYAGIISFVVLISKCESQGIKCENISDIENNEFPIPNFINVLEGSFVLQLEMTYIKGKNQNRTFYVTEVREHQKYGKKKGNSGAVYIWENNTETIYHYYPDKQVIVEERDGVCRQTGDWDMPSFNEWGWWDDMPQHGDTLYGPSALLRRVNFTNTKHLPDDGEVRLINGIICERWFACEGQQSIEVYYYFSKNPWEMANAPFFEIAKGEGVSLPVQFEVLFLDDSEIVQYNIVNFIPFIDKTNHRLLEVPRGSSCEDLVGVIGDLRHPRIANHFSLKQEYLINPSIDGAQGGRESVDGYQLTYSEELSLVRNDFKNQEGNMLAKDEMTFIDDFNTGVEYIIDRRYGNCTITWLGNGFDTHHSGLLQTGASMLGPNQLFHLDDSYAFVAYRGSRGLDAELWTSTRDDIPDPATGGTENFGKTVVEWYFVPGVEMVGDEMVNTFTPIRGDFFYYNKSNTAQVTDMTTLNIYDFKFVHVYSPDEFSVSDCYEHDSWDWSYIEIIFPANGHQIAAVKQNPDLFRHNIMYLLMTEANLSPVRIADIDVSEGVAAPGGNFSASKVVLANIRLLERAPYIFSYSRPGDEPDQRPGENQMAIENIKYVDECAELCSGQNGLECKSFHMCDGYFCFLSSLDVADGKPVETVDVCEHWINTIQNATFTDTPSFEVNHLLLDSIRHDRFKIMLDRKDDDDITHKENLTASQSLHYRNPTPMDFIKSQFSLESRQTAIKIPNVEIQDVEDMDACQLLCVSWTSFRCVTVVYLIDQLTCQMSPTHYDVMVADGNMTSPSSRSYLFARHYLVDYSPVFGGVSINTTSGIDYEKVDNLDKCARLCTEEKNITCRSFEFCDVEMVCHLHKETYLDVADGDIVHSGCMHFSQKNELNFSPYTHQGTSYSDHQLVAVSTDTQTCAKLCLEAGGGDSCESYDFCTRCGSNEWDVCGEENQNSTKLCFLNSNHVGEDGFKLIKASQCTHFSRDVFGDVDYATWLARQSKGGTGNYTAGDMTGLAFGMIFLGILVSIGFLYAVVYYGNSQDVIDSATAATPKMAISFLKLKHKTGESDI